MTVGQPFQWSLSDYGFLRESIKGLVGSEDITDAVRYNLETALRGLFDGFPTDRSPNEGG